MGRVCCVVSVTGGALTSNVQLEWKTWHCQCVGDEKSGITIPLLCSPVS